MQDKQFEAQGVQAVIGEPTAYDLELQAEHVAAAPVVDASPAWQVSQPVNIVEHQTHFPLLTTYPDPHFEHTPAAS